MTSEPIHYLVIEPSGTVRAEDGILNVGDAQDIVEGDIEVLPEPRDVTAVLIANTEGKRVGLDANWAATKLIRSSLRSTDFVAGNVIVAGPPDRSGNLSSLTSEQEQTVRDIVADG